MAKFRVLVPVVLGASVLSGCAPFIPYRSIKSVSQRNEPQKKTNLEQQALCDVDRARARVRILKRAQVEKFREVALKISREVTQEEISDLQRMASSASRRGGGESSWEIGRRRSELVSEIYTGALLRAGFKPSTTERIQGADLSYTVGVDAVADGGELYAEIVQGHLLKAEGEEGKISQVSLAPNADQSRYYVRLYQFSRYEAGPDGSQLPVYNTMSLYDAVEQTLPHYCSQVETALDLKEFNTIVGLDANASEAPASHRVPSPERSSVPAPAPVTPAPAVPAPAAPAPLPATSPAGA